MALTKSIYVSFDICEMLSFVLIYNSDSKELLMLYLEPYN